MVDGKPLKVKLSKDDPDADVVSTHSSTKGNIVVKRLANGRTIFVLEDQDESCVAYDIAPKVSTCVKF